MEAQAAEPATTSLLKALAARRAAVLFKLEYRLKTVRSATRKLLKHKKEDPKLVIETATLDDMLRYTMRIEDEPEGHYVATVREVLLELERNGYAVDRVKNYWPREDNYSGINCVMRASIGLQWELQFHTAASLATAAKTRPMYEEMRKVATPRARKGVLFDQMTRLWSAVPVPHGALDEGAIHRRAKIIVRPRP
jgi:hypothetical protein